MTRNLLYAHTHLSEYDHAIRLASEYIESHRAEPSPRAWRGELYERQKNYEAAAADYRDGLALFSDPGNVHVNVYWQLADALDKAGKPCEGVVVLRTYLSFEPVKRRTSQISTLISDMSRRGKCAAETAGGKTEIRFRDRSGALIVDARVNGRPGRFVVDTGASALSLTRAYAEKAGLSFSDEREVLLQTANGVLTGRQSQAETVQLAGATAKNVYAVVLPEGKRLGPEIDGLLGLSFLANFDMRISGNRLTLAPPDTGG